MILAGKHARLVLRSHRGKANVIDCIATLPYKKTLRAVYPSNPFTDPFTHVPSKTWPTEPTSASK
jgi:hypothetical protein